MPSSAATPPSCSASDARALSSDATLLRTSSTVSGGGRPSHPPAAALAPLAAADPLSSFWRLPPAPPLAPPGRRFLDAAAAEAEPIND